MNPLILLILAGFGASFFFKETPKNNSVDSSWAYPVKKIASTKIFNIYKTGVSNPAKPVIFIFSNKAKQLSFKIPSNLGELYFIEIISKNEFEKISFQWHLSGVGPNSVFFNTESEDIIYENMGYVGIINHILDFFAEFDKLNIISGKRKIYILGYEKGVGLLSKLPDPYICYHSDEKTTTCPKIKATIIPINNLSDVKSKIKNIL